jgi:phenylacetate-coenzyme A ligase PaaK-like adenylate-forming protein
MGLAYQAKRAVDVTRGLGAARRLAEVERWPRERLERLQRERVDALVRHAVARAPFHRERLGPLVGRETVELGTLPAMDKATMMERFDDVVTDRRLRRDALLAHVESLDDDALYLGRHRVMTTSGSSGRKGLFVYDREGWRGICAMFLRHNAMAGVGPRLPRLRMAMIGGGAPTHMSRRGAATLRSGIHRLLPLSVTMPIPRIVAALNAFRPDFVYTYPSVATLLADEQLGGRLRIAPEAVSTSSELRTPEMTERIEAAFGVHPTDLYATTEGLWGSECELGAGVHVFEDMAVLENVDDDGRAVPVGAPGARVLVTNLFNRVQPLVRLEVTDVLTLDPEPCPCGRSLRRIRAIEGRADDIIWLPGAERPVAVHPMQFSVITADRDVREFQVVQDGERLRLRLALRDEATAERAAGRVRDRVAGRLAAIGAHASGIEVETCAGVERAAGGKYRMIVADPAAAPRGESGLRARAG